MYENTTLLNGYCHLVNKTLLFVRKYFEGIVPAGRLDQDLYWKTKALYDETASLLEEQRLEEAECLLEEFLRYSNGYFEEGRPWENHRENRRACRNTVLNTIQLVANLTVLLSPVIDYPTQKVSGWLGLTHDWKVQNVHSGYELPETESIAILDTDTECGA